LSYVPWLDREKAIPGLFRLVDRRNVKGSSDPRHRIQRCLS